MREKKAKADKPRILRWRGVLGYHSRKERLVFAALCAVACLSLSCCQLGFVGIGLPGQYSAYAVVLLLPIAIAALLLGTFWGTAIGLFAGAALYAHSQALPLDYYELTFITPLTSIIMLTVIGFMLGFFLAVALRKNPGQIKRIIYIIIVCFVVSFLYSFGFAINVVIQLAAELVSESYLQLSDAQQEAALQTGVMTLALRLGDVWQQVFVDAILMALSCIVVDFVVRKSTERLQQKRIGLRAMYAIWLSVVVLFAFMITAGVTFVAITAQEYDDASNALKQEVGYLCDQLSESTERVEALNRFLDRLNVNYQEIDEEGYQDFLKAISADTLLNGYSVGEDGIIIIAVNITDDVADSVIYQSNDSEFEQSGKLNDFLAHDVIDAVKLSCETDSLQRVVYDGAKVDLLVNVEGDAIKTHIAYLYARVKDDYLVMAMQSSDKVFADRGPTMLWIGLSELVLLLAVYAFTQALLSRVFVRRIDETNEVLGRITDGDLDARVEMSDTRELESLSKGINETVGALKGWIAEAETRMDAELATAKAIQEAALPRTFPPFPDITKFDIYASMHAAREVGGDFYDFFLIGDESDAEGGKLAFVIADVSGKGVPAALFMMKAMTQIRGYLGSGMEVGEAIENANRQLCDGNDAGMFVTAWAGVLDYGSGFVEYVNAGHNPPLLWQKETGWRWLTEKSGLPLGLFDGFGYDAYSVKCSIGDQFVLYTDGVTEAMSVDGELYGEDRLEALMGESYMLHPRKLVETVRHDVARHASGAEQSDDITMLALEVGVPPEVTATIVLPADDKQLPVVNEFIHTELDRRLCPKRAQNQLDIAVEELFVNVCHYAYPDATPEHPGTVSVSYTYSADPPSVMVNIIDEGIPYDPLAKPDAVTPGNIMDVPIGGLGILMAKKSVNDMTYERVDGHNMVSIYKKW